MREKLYWKLFNTEEFWDEMHNQWTDDQVFKAIETLYYLIGDLERYDKKIRKLITPVEELMEKLAKRANN